MKALLLVCCLLMGSLYALDTAPQKIEFVLYSKPGCVPCQHFKETLERLKIKIIEGTPNGNDGVKNVPTLIVLVNNIEQKRIVGNVDSAKLLEELASFMYVDHCLPEAEIIEHKQK